ncbi:hypothetical protein ITP53_29210 [Nonomuraea sp. K274]|uniref:Uncharacterized protein n=1 Tax=Nonomuraea cypriaca TaxID=1187855 RepID=A0A931F333_9ACTN|nr:hypothetical protein [Nonomuraea cypriaca]MBF8189741.1 hypothetical protein [Nonomuraea cypriaca]
MAANEVTRRRVLGTGLGVGIAAAIGPLKAASAIAEASAPRRLGAVPVSMSLHTHSSFSEGGSWAGGGGGASMMAQLDQAMKAGIDVVWWSDHDWRMSAYGYYDNIAFDGTDEDGGLQWVVENSGTVTDAQHAFVDDPHSPDEAGKAMRVAATGPAAEWGVSYLWANTGNSFYSTNLSDTTLEIDVLGEQIGPDAEIVVQVETSFRPETAGRPKGVYVLEYRLGTETSRRLETPLTGVVTTTSTGEWQTLRMNLLDDVKAFWPDLIAEDSGLARLRFGARARDNATAQGVFDRLRIDRARDRTGDPLKWPVKHQRELMRRLSKRYPTVTQLLSSEVSMIRHMNVYMEDFELYPYPDRGKAPVLDNSIEGIEKVVKWYHDRGALVQYNHPPINHAELVATRALGTDLMEVCDATGNLTVTTTRLTQYDVAARNAIFLTATSQIDDHAGQNWIGQPHLFATSLWAHSKSAGNLLRAMASGQAWFQHQRLWPTGQIDMTVGHKRAMGAVIRTDATSVPVDLFVGNLPADATVQVVVGVCDRKGDTTPAVEKHPYPASAFAEGTMRFPLDRQNGRYLRVEVHDSSGALLGAGNPLWLLPAGEDIEIPKARRLTLTPADLK